MKAKINAKMVTGLEAKDKPYEVGDTVLPGFLIRVQPSGAKVYYVRYRLHNGKQTRFRLGPAAVLTAVQARDRAKTVLADVVKDADPADKRRKAKAHTLASFLDVEYEAWMADQTRNTKDGKSQVSRIRSAFREFLSKQITDINAWQIEKKWRSGRLKAGRAKATVNKDIAALKSALSRAVEWGFLTENPLATVKPIKEDDDKKIRYLEPDEERRLMEALDAREERIRRKRDSHNAWLRERGLRERPSLRKVPFADHLKPMVMLSLNTGLRRGELFGIEWGDVNLERGMLTVRSVVTKTIKTRHVALNSTARAVFQEWKAQTEGKGLVFKNKQGRAFDNVNKSWKAVLRAAAIEHFRWHDMRHHFASRLAMAGVDLNTIRELLGHSDIKMTLRYSHLSPEAKLAAVEQIVDTAPANVVPFGQATKTSG